MWYRPGFTLSTETGSQGKAHLQVRGLQAGYGPIAVLRGINFDAKPGLTVILGPNGAGKTTLLRALNALIPRQGDVLLDGDELPDRTDEIVEAGVAWLVPKAQRAGRIEAVFNDFPKLRERASQLAGTMSGGEQQMVAVARAMVCAPRLLMLDEPSLGLAPKMVDELLAIARRIADGGTTVLMVEQNVKKALAVADRGYVLERGEIVASGPSKLLARSTVIQETYLGAAKEGTTNAREALRSINSKTL
jgi:branched-chain amino acid transport system ATP-binding protein